MKPYSLPVLKNTAIGPSIWQKVEWQWSVDRTRTYGTLTVSWKHNKLVRRFDMREDSWRDHGSPEAWLIHQRDETYKDLCNRLEKGYWT